MRKAVDILLSQYFQSTHSENNVIINKMNAHRKIMMVK